jgi:2-keto-3-deoxy-L-fuconate dehydrogenase
MSDRLKGKRAFVTAGAAGIGRACALAFTREGATVIATDIDEAGLKALKKDGVAETHKLDVRDTAAVAAMANKVGKVDILLNAAGFVHNGTVLDCSDGDWDFSFDLNVKSMHRTIRAFLPLMLEGGGGSIVNIASAAGVFKAAPNRYVYSATKAAVAARSRSTSSPKASVAIRSAPEPSKRRRCSAARRRSAAADARCSSAASRWDGSVPPRKSRRSRSISPATRAPSPPASITSSMAAGRCRRIIWMFFVIASEAKQSRKQQGKTGLLRRKCSSQ